MNYLTKIGSDYYIQVIDHHNFIPREGESKVQTRERLSDLLLETLKRKNISTRLNVSIGVDFILNLNQFPYQYLYLKVYADKIDPHSMLPMAYTEKNGHYTYFKVNEFGDYYLFVN